MKDLKSFLDNDLNDAQNVHKPEVNKQSVSDLRQLLQEAYDQLDSFDDCTFQEVDGDELIHNLDVAISQLDYVIEFED